MNPEQISAEQRSRLAYVYVRQSSPHQVMNHRESQIRQRGLETRAQDLGWQNDRVIIIEDDTGTSASRSSPRSAFEAMVADAALGNVGLIVSLEVSRLSRGNRNWYHLLDICAVTRTLIADADGLYDPRSYNDRLLLGLKGTMSEAELHIMKERLVEAVRSKAKRGEFRMPLPPGYVWDEADRMRKTPDEQVVSAIALIFERFARLGCVHQVQCSLADDHIQVPVLNGPKKSVRFALPGYSYLHRMLTNPTYAGAYVFGKRQVEEVLDASQRPRKRTRHRPQKDWHSLIKDHHEGYITFETYEKNQRLIAQNRRGQPGPGAPREGPSLIQGLVLCGQCGRRMRVSYGRRGRLIRYSCVTHRKQTGGPVCQAFGSLRLERALERLLLEALEPLGWRP